MSQTEYHVLTRDGDACAEVEEVLKQLKIPRGRAGLHKCMFVTRANQTVVMTSDVAAPLAAALRGRPGWKEPSSAA